MLNIRRARYADLDAVCRIEGEGDATWSRASFSDELQGNAWVLVACFEDHIAGFAIGRFDGLDAELLKISVEREYRRQGAARALLQELLHICKQNSANVCHLEVNVSNTAAIALYTHSGFEITGRRKAYYKTADGRKDALLMARSLSDL